LLGFPVSVHPLDLVRDRLPPHTPPKQLPGTRSGPVVTAGARLPGWTGGQSFYLSDADAFVSVRLQRKGGLHAPQPWQPVLVHGRWQRDEYGASWLAAERIEEVA
jgi:hypothetical protein